jgi:hypothetical protein
MNPYTRRIDELIRLVPRDLVGTLEPSDERIHVPTQAFSDFIINKELGDWAEDVIKRGIEMATPEFSAIRYGRSESLVAGEPGFKEFYTDYIMELRTFGKRPDILIYGEGAPSGKHLEGKSAEALIPIARQALVGIEVRSSQQSLVGTRSADDLSFTPKIEDIANVYRWIKNHGVKHFYFQLIFGAVFAISFERILELLIIGPRKGGYKIAQEQRNQFKSTVYLPLSLGTKLSSGFRDPILTAFRKQLSTGRMLFGVSFSEGEVTFDARKLRSLISS